MAYPISEKTIEDILCADKVILAELLDCNPSNLSLIARQKNLNSGKLDLLCLYEDTLLLIELKVVPFYEEITDQINGYQNDLQELQRQNKLINAYVRKIVLVTAYLPSEAAICEKQSIQLRAYKPEQVLAKYFENFRELSYFLKIQSGDYGVVRLGLLNTTLRLLSEGKIPEQICSIEGKARKTIKNRLSVAILLGLISKYRGEYFLTDLGASFIEAGETSLYDRLSEDQSDLLANFVKENPFFSSITYTILSFLETVFVLAKSAYPVEKGDAQSFFVKSVGKEQTWKTPRARNTATYIFSNYACDLNLLAMIDNQFYITPKGIQAILLLQLNRSIKLIASQK